MKMYSLAIGALAFIGGGIAGLPQAPQPAPAISEPVPVIAELFTSEGCSSCPPADALLQKLTKTQPVPGVQIIALGYHVDYWNRLGWRDSFSLPEYSQRQENYRLKFHNAEVYTPQLVVNGQAEFVGSDADQATRRIAQAGEQMRRYAVQISIKPKEGNWYRVSVAGLPASSRHHLWVATTEDGLFSQVTRGENAGHRLDHVAVVRQLISVGNKTTADIVLPLSAEQKRENSHIVAWVQQGETGQVIGATQISR